MTKTRVAILVELPKGEADTPGLRKLLKALTRCYGMRVLGIRPPSETATFAGEEPKQVEQ